MKHWRLLLVGLVLSSCEKDDCGCAPIERSLEISVTDANGNTLLDQENFEEIETFYPGVDGLHLLPDQPVFIDRPNTPTVRIFLHANQDAEFPVTYVKWNEMDTDTIKASFRNANRSIDKVRLNGVLLEHPNSQGFSVVLK